MRAPVERDLYGAGLAVINVVSTYPSRSPFGPSAGRAGGAGKPVAVVCGPSRLEGPYPYRIGLGAICFKDRNLSLIRTVDELLVLALPTVNRGWEKLVVSTEMVGPGIEFLRPAAYYGVPGDDHGAASRARCPARSLRRR